jgi:molecular chaperone GrpE
MFTKKDKKNKEAEGGEPVEPTNNETQETEEKPAIDDPVESIVSKEEEYLNNWKRAVADFENYKKRQAESQKDLLRYSLEGIIMQILPVLDNFHASTDHIPEDQKSNAWVVGIMHIQKQLEDLLKNNEVEEIEAKIGDEFNPRLHEAIKVENKIHPVKSAEGGPDKPEFNRVNKVIQKGYMIGGKVIRPTRVVVE